MNDNELIAKWAGIECRCKETPPFLEILKQLPFTTVTTCQLHPTPPDYDRDEVAINLLPLIMGKGLLKRVMLDCYRILPDTSLVWRIEGYKGPYPSQHFMGDSKPTIAAAIKAACLQLIKGGA